MLIEMKIKMVLGIASLAMLIGKGKSEIRKNVVFQQRKKLLLGKKSS